MKFIFLDDSRQKNPKRARMGPLVGVGGIIVDADALGSLESEIDLICTKSYRFPARAMFKWSPGSGDWFRSAIIGEEREAFYADVLLACKNHAARAVVAVCDVTKTKANSSATDSEIDALILTLERFHTSLSSSEPGFVVVAKPSGGTTSENKMLATCMEHKSIGTDYVKFSKLAQNPVVMQSAHSRVLQAADLVVSVTTAMVSGNTEYAEKIFPMVSRLFLRDWRGLIGGTGLKVHPFLLYKNLHFWVLQEDAYAKGSTGWSLPENSCPYASNPLIY
ncbi:hypothetical protein C5F48_06055 [Cereibacter changlensis JA139]|uniref:DUF3800 domain-containing protein n=2 Tax=Cereibacter changlensis TaxID=402884 RepID=A0A2T4JXE7_9RHOB|nr:DUF3800 domain-containing protein [Cereibacter changlensis]PTE22599.1 hypothetical protein C5F48_06055 [Cereibacter changlensis JA139]PZX53793.1 uncharacterized protein DUF3800 [Cereibacter changlensis]